MGQRHSGRKLAVQLLYQAATRSEELASFVDAYIETSEYDDTVKKWGKSLGVAVWKKRDDYDKLISQYAIGWTLDRISLIDLSVLRLAFYEFELDETPPRIVINEAIELVKEFSSDEAPKFVNGILGKYLDQHVHRHHH